MSRRKLHIDDLPKTSDGVVVASSGQEVEGLTTCFFQINAKKLFLVLNKIGPIFLAIAWLTYIFESFSPFHWSPYGDFLRYNFVNEKKNFIRCKNATEIINFGTPSLLRMAVLKSFPNIFFRASILPMLVGRLFFLAIIQTKWRRSRGDAKYDFVEPMTMALATIELVSLSTFASTSSPHDSLYFHKTFGVTFVIIAFFGFIAVSAMVIDLEKTPKIPLTRFLICCAAIFCVSAPPALISYFDFAENRTCSPMVKVHLTIFEILAMISYIAFYWKANQLIEDVEIIVYSSKAELIDWENRSNEKENKQSN
uniref:Uncharacterized protein n=1 Tax=Panagrolaimus sp. JU765 TaxID=591449 RepID=A0AC34PVD0_9BILA